MKQTIQRARIVSWKQDRRQMDRSLAFRGNYGLNRVYKSVLENAASRLFDSVAELGEWCKTNSPKHLANWCAK